MADESPKRAIGTVEAVRPSTITRNRAVKATTTASNQIKALLVGSDQDLRDQMRVQSLLQLATPGQPGCSRPRTRKVLTLTGNSAMPMMYGVGGYDEANPRL
jgi:hypothetical protein